MFNKFLKTSLALVFTVGVFSVEEITAIKSASAASTGKSGLPLPRFVSIKAKRVNMRVGPGKQYKVDWLYQKRGLPLEIIQEYDNWRKVRDAEGNEGWILHSLLSGKRTALVKPWNVDEKSKIAKLFKSIESNSVLAHLEPGVLTDIKSCNGTHCRITVADVEGYISKDALWGVYPDEKIED